MTSEPVKRFLSERRNTNFERREDALADTLAFRIEEYLKGFCYEDQVKSGIEASIKQDPEFYYQLLTEFMTAMKQERD